jgi:hypothetical protein
MAELHSTRGILIVAVTIGLLGSAGAGEAGWWLDPLSRTPVCTADGVQNFPILVAVDGGFIVAWRDGRRLTTSVDVYAQKITIDGEALWPVNGRVVAEGPAGALLGHLQEIVGATHDLDGGVLISWNDSWAATTELTFLTRVAADGWVGWGNPGLPIQGGDTAVPLHDQRGFLSEPQIYGLGWGPVVDSEGGAWVLGHAWGTRNYFVTRMAPDGSHRSGWFHDPSDQGGGEMRLLPNVEFDGDDSVIVAWIKGMSSFGCDATARKVLDPEILWPAEPDVLESPWGAEALGGSPWTAGRFDAAADGAGGMVAAWMDDRSGGQRAYAQRISGDGAVLWAAGGVEVSGDTLTGQGWSWAQQLAAAADGTGGGVVAWNLLDALGSVRAQRVSAAGSLLWGDDGVTVFADIASGPQAMDVVRTSDGGFVVLYRRASTAFQGLIVQKLAANGTALWGAGRVIYSGCTNTYGEIPSSMVSDGDGGVVVAFAPCDANVYIHRIGSNYILDDGFELGDFSMWSAVVP